MNWIHCNRCNIHCKSCPNFHITSCGHLFCIKCVNEAQNQRKCLWCKNDCEYSPVNKQMSPEIKMFFKDPFEHLQNFLNCYKFQQMHRNILLQHGNKDCQAYEKFKYQLDREREQSRKLQIAFKAAEREFDYAKSHLARLEQQQVPTTIPFTPNTNSLAFSYRISPYDLKSVTRSAAIPSFIDHPNSNRTPIFTVNRTIDSNCSSLLPTNSSDGRSAGTNRFTPYSTRADRSFPSSNRTVADKTFTPHRGTPVRNVTPVANISRPIFQIPRSNENPTLPRSNHDSNHRPRPDLDPRSNLASSSNFVPRSIINSNSNLDPRSNLVSTSMFSRPNNLPPSNLGPRPIVIPAGVHRPGTQAYNAGGRDGMENSPFQQKLRQLSANQAQRLGFRPGTQAYNAHSGNRTPVAMPNRPPPLRQNINNQMFQRPLQYPYFNHPHSSATFHGKHISSSPPLISQD